jgi:hypothetical protein
MKYKFNAHRKRLAGINALLPVLAAAGGFIVS